MALGHLDGLWDAIGDNGANPNVIDEHRRSKYELSELQQVMLLLRRDS